MTSQQLPRANLFDVPEFMPGASPSANPAQRMEFETRCKQLHHEAEEESPTPHASVSTVSAGTTVDELVLMFPSIDPDLVRILTTEAPTPQHALETLLALVASSSEPTVPPLPPKELPLGDENLFPSLTDSDGWQVVTQAQLERDPDKDLGNAWSSRAKAVASKPAPASGNTSAVVPKRRVGGEKEGYNAEAALPMTDYELRHRRGEQKAKNRAQFGRGGKGIGKGVGRGRKSADHSDESESDESEEEASKDE